MDPRRTTAEAFSTNEQGNMGYLWLVTKCTNTSLDKERGKWKLVVRTLLPVTPWPNGCLSPIIKGFLCFLMGFHAFLVELV